MNEKLEILYQDDHYVAINKPHGMLVHRSKIAKDVTTFALQTLRDQLGKQVSPAHRIDRKTSGVLLFAFDKEGLSKIRKLFEDNDLTKTYMAIVRGYAPSKQTIDYPLQNDHGKLQKAVTSFETIATTEIDIPLGKHSTSRYSLVKVHPQTGRMHQIRKHFAHIMHPIIGDRPHGCNKQNRLFLKKWNISNMFLHARQLRFIHPLDHYQVTITAPPQPEFEHGLEILSFNQSVLEESF